jgi:putative acetyltransferase
MNNTLRPAVAADSDAIAALYKKVSRISGGLARREEEVTTDYIGDIIEKTRTRSGIHFVMVHEPAGIIVGEIHCYKPGLECFDHLLGDLTIAVDPDFQGQGIGKALFTAVLSEVSENRKDILRIELLTGETNKKALAFYQSLGFTIEGRMPNRYKLSPADHARLAADHAAANARHPSQPASGSANAPQTALAASPTSVFDADIPMAWLNPNYQK